MNCPHCGKAVRLVADGSKTAQNPKTPSDLKLLIDSVNLDTLDAKERKFIDDIAYRCAKYGSKFGLSDKQVKWLKDLAEHGGHAKSDPRQPDGGPFSGPITDDDIPF